ncbi:MAG: DinB family protein [Chloroflexi bacterium]|nr:DinB family protein [Chloroflexota bacterium]
MGREAIEQYLYWMDEAFDGPDEHSLLNNLSSLHDRDWDARPPGGQRRAWQIVNHVGACKFMYADHAFAQGELTWQTVDAATGFGRSPAEIIGWLRRGHDLLRSYVAALGDDAELLVERRANWGEMKETRWLVRITIEHDLYHGGEINHIRSVLQGTDRWAHEE